MTTPYQRPSRGDLIAGLAPFAAVDSGSNTDHFRAVLRDGAGPLGLSLALATMEVDTVGVDGADQRLRVLGQIRHTTQTNRHHENPLLQAHLRAHGEIPGLSGRADHRVCELYPVDAILLDDQGGVIAKAPPSAVVPPTGTEVRLADNATIASFISPGTPGLLNMGLLPGTAHLPFSLPHHGDRTPDDPDGVGEGRHVGIFGPSGAGKTVLLSQFMTGWARHRRMGQIVFDHDGDISRMKIGLRQDGSCHFDLAAALTAAGRNLGEDVIRVGIDSIRIEAPGDVAQTLVSEHFFADLGVGRGSVMADVHAKVAMCLRTLLENQPFHQLSYADAIQAICAAVSEAYAVGKTNAQGESERDRKRENFLQTATGGGPTQQSLERTWQRVQGYNSRPNGIVDLVEAGLLNGKIVIIALSGASGVFDQMVLQRTVRTMLDVARCCYLLADGSSDVYRYGYLRDRFARYKRATVNAIAVIDEAHLVAGEDAAREEDSVAANLRDAIRRTRKLRLGFCFATQEIQSVAKPIFLGLHTKVFAYGLKSQAELERVKEVLTEPSAYKQYQRLPDPKASGIYSFAVTGAALPIANGAALFMRAYADQATFMAANHLTAGAVAQPRGLVGAVVVVSPPAGLDRFDD